MKKIIIIAMLILGVYQWQQSEQPSNPSYLYPQKASSLVKTSSDALLKQAFDNRQSNIQIKGSGTVIKILPDDNKGIRHQRFILKLHSGQTLLISHNIDLASKINTLAVGDNIQFFGEYEWNNKGGIIHWTHHDPNGNHVNGWLIHNGQHYQ